jgi:peptidoglycan/xylan/chitin deacetylase (PgdA/CDA1 family)
LFHPCEGSASGREWVKPENDLNNYTVQRMADEISMANILLTAIDGKKERTFAYPCGDMKVREASYVAKIQTEFVAERGVRGIMQHVDEVDVTDIGSFMISGETGDQLIALVKEAISKKALLVFLFHGVGGEHNLNVSLEAHRQLLQFLKEHEHEIWVAPMVEIGTFVKGQRE